MERVNAGGDAPPDPPSVVTSRANPTFFVFSRKDFWRIKANERDNILARAFELHARLDRVDNRKEIDEAWHIVSSTAVLL